MRLFVWFLGGWKVCLRVLTIFLLAGCSVEPVTRTKTVADDNFILGAVFDGSNYSLMLCKTSPTSARQFTDHENCRPALLDDHGKAVVFSPEQIKMTLGERLAGFSKGLAVIASVPLVVIGGRRAAMLLNRRNVLTKDFEEINQLLISSKKLIDESEQMVDVNPGSKLIEKLKKNHIQLGEARSLNETMKKRLDVDGLAVTVKDNNEKLLAKSEQLLVALRKKTDDRIKSLTDENGKRIEKVSNDQTVSLIRTEDNVPEELKKFPVGSFRRDVEMNHLYEQIVDRNDSYLLTDLLDWWHNERQLSFLSELAEGKTFDADVIHARFKKPITKVYSGDSLEEYFEEFPEDRKLVAELIDFPDDMLPNFLSRFKMDWKESNWTLFKDGYRHYRELTLEREHIEIIELLKKKDTDIPSVIVDYQQQTKQRLLESKRKLLKDNKLWNFGQEDDGVFESSARDSLNAIVSSRSEINLLSNELDYLKNIDKDKLIDLWNNDTFESTIPTTISRVEITSELENFTVAKRQLDEAKNKYNEAVREVEKLDRQLQETEYLLSSDSEIKGLVDHRYQLIDNSNEKFQQATEKLIETGERYNNDINDINNNINNDKILAGSAVILTAIATFIDSTSRHVWGYDQRQVSKHWQRIFSQKTAKLHRVEDVTRILRTIAKSRNFTINPEALALAN